MAVFSDGGCAGLRLSRMKVISGSDYLSTINSAITTTAATMNSNFPTALETEEGEPTFTQ
ncbi:MAG: hypothetical protein AAF268_08455 [Cyanobacteria bacterium P01_A01_bin.3]